MNQPSLYFGWISLAVFAGIALIATAPEARRAEVLWGAETDALISKAAPGPLAHTRTEQAAAERRFSQILAVRTDESEDRRDVFEHLDHDGLFPLCTGCHLGAESGEEALLYPPTASCTECHDGQTEEEVAWDGPAPLATNLHFDHGEHGDLNTDAGEPSIGCAQCHGDPGEGILADPVLEAGSCLSCHDEVRADQVVRVRSDEVGHFVDADCTSCHVAAGASTLDAERIAAIPTPTDHDTGGFLAESHGSAAFQQVEARCATCHVQDQCATCHVNAVRVNEIQRLLPEPAGRPFPEIEAHYPTPATHEVDRFDWEHVGVAEADGANCATCHTEDSCRSCHIEPVPSPVQGLVPAALSRAPGAEVVVTAPDSHENAFFFERHGIVAGSTSSSCATCHEPESFCGSCHESVARGGVGYHDPGYVLSHAAEAASGIAECSTCHDATAFCQSCHAEVGLQSRGRLGPGYHDAEPLWLLRHPQAARQQLETCTTCHTQRDCLQCHSQVGAFQISPHGPGFDARAAWERNPVVCRACHLGSPFGGGP